MRQHNGDHCLLDDRAVMLRAHLLVGPVKVPPLNIVGDQDFTQAPWLVKLMLAFINLSAASQRRSAARVERVNAPVYLNVNQVSSGAQSPNIISRDYPRSLVRRADGSGYEWIAGLHASEHRP